MKLHNGDKQRFRPKMFLKVFLTMYMGASFLSAQHSDIIIPQIDGIRITPGLSVPILPEAETALAFQFADGRLVVGKGERSMWSYDHGQTWQSGPASPGEKVALDLGGGEIISIRRNTRRKSGDIFVVKQKRSTDNWKTVEAEEATVTIPNVSHAVTGGGDMIDGFLFHHGLQSLPDGQLIAAMYGNFEGDTELCEGYPPALGQRKYRTVVVFSGDKGHTWGDPVLVAYDKMLGRGIPDDHPLAEKGLADERSKPTAIVPAITQEGFREAELVMAANGDIICLMRSGGRNGGTTNLFPTPLYCSRSEDAGKTWTPPAQIADRGVCPNAVTLQNGIIVCAYSRPGNWLIFSDNNGRSWKGAFQFGDTRNYCYIEEVESNTIQVYHEVKTDSGKTVYGTFFKIEKKLAH